MGTEEAESSRDGINKSKARTDISTHFYTMKTTWEFTIIFFILIFVDTCSSFGGAQASRFIKGRRKDELSNDFLPRKPYSSLYYYKMCRNYPINCQYRKRENANNLKQYDENLSRELFAVGNLRRQYERDQRELHEKKARVPHSKHAYMLVDRVN